MEEESRAKKRQRRYVVSEEAYTSTLSTIIQRDYFSDLSQLQLRAAVLAHRDAHDVAGAVAARRAARKIQSHEEKLKELETQEEENMEDGIRRTARPLHRENLTGFHNRVTSEDNAEFHQVQRKEIRANEERLEALFKPVSNLQQLRLLKSNGEEEDCPYPALASDEYNPPCSKFEWKQPDARNGLFFVPNPSNKTNNHHGNDGLKLLQNSSALQESKNNVRAFMPPPSPNNKQSVVSSVPINAKQFLVEYVPKSRIKKKIEPSQTRFPPSPATTAENPLALRTKPSPDDSAIESNYSTDASTDLESDGRSLSVERRTLARRLDIDKGAFVSMTPLVVPGYTDKAEASPIITWGTVVGAPLLVAKEGKDAILQQNKTSSFRLAEESCRGMAARQATLSLEQRISRAKSAISTRTSQKEDCKRRRGEDRVTAKRDESTFGPAAKSLLAKMSKKRNQTSARSASSLGFALRSSNTQQRGRNGSSSVSRLRDSATYRATPRFAAARSNTAEASEAKLVGVSRKHSRNITAGLLDL